MKFQFYLLGRLAFAAVAFGPQAVFAQGSGYSHDDSGNLISRTNQVSQPPDIVGQPQLQVSEAGGTASFSVTVRDAAGTSYQWLFNGAAITGATNASFLATNVAAANAGGYSAIVSNSSGVITSSVARLAFNFEQIKVWGENSLFQQAVPLGINNAVSSLMNGSAQVTSVAAGSGHTLALLSDGRVVGWGQNERGQASPPDDLSDAIFIAANKSYYSDFSAAVRSDGNVVEWGDTSGIPLPAGLSNVVSVAGGFGHMLALKADGMVVAWGANNYGQTSVPPGLSTVVAVAAGLLHSLALKADGTVVAWGNNGYGQITVPVGLSNVIAIASGGDYNLALKADGNVVAWGQNSYGETNVPVGLSNVVSISAGMSHNLALKSDRTVVAWGWNSSGQTAVPIGLTNVLAVAAGYAHSVALTDAGVGTLAPLLLTRSFPLAFVTLPYQFRVQAKNGVSSYSASGLPPGLGINSVSGLVSGTPTSEGTFPVTLSAVNSLGTNSVTVNLVVYRPVPQIYSVTNAVAYAGNNFQYQILANNGATSYGATGLPLGLSINPVNGLVSGFPAQIGLFNPTITASNSAGIGTATLTIKVQEIAAWGYEGNTDVPVGLSNIVAVGAGGSDSLALQGDGTVVAWGSSSLGGTNVPAGLGNVVSVSAGGFHRLALKADGTVVGWGDNTYGQVSMLGGLSNVVAVAGGGLHSLALVDNGTVVAFGQATLPAGLSSVVGVAAGYNHNLALKADGTVTGWGNNDFGGATVPAGLSNVVTIAAGYNNSIALKNDGTVVVWGWINGAPLPDLSNVVAVAAGTYHCAALKADGTVVVWGSNGYGENNVPANLSNVLSLDTGASFSLALMKAEPGLTSPLVATRSLGLAIVGSSYRHQVLAKNSTTIFAASGLPVGLSINPATGLITGIPTIEGKYSVVLSAGNAFGTNQVGVNLVVHRPVPQIYSSPNAVAYSGNFFQHQILADNGATGYGASGLPLGLSVNAITGVISGTPSQVGEFNVAISVTNSFGFTTASLMIRIRMVAEWGYNFYGQTNVPMSLTNIARLAAGAFHSLALDNNGKVVAWGYNAYGQTNVPSQLSNVVRIAAGDYHSVALKSDGKVVAWGYDGSGQTNMPVGLSNVLAIAAGSDHNLAMRADGTVTAWGGNSYGQTSVPVGLSNVVMISAGSRHSTALKSGGTVVVWGDNSLGQRNVPTLLSNVVAVAAGGFHNLALKSDGKVIAWGDNSSGQSTVPINLSNVVAVAGGWYHSLALKLDGTVVAWGGNGYGETALATGLSNVVAVAAGGYNSLILLGTSAGQPFPVTIQVPSFSSSNGFAINFGVSVSQNYEVQASSNLLNWVVLGNILATNTPAHFTDASATNYPQRFYRVRSVGP